MTPLLNLYTVAYKERAAQIDLVGICDDYTSFLWDIEYYDTGRFEIYLPATAVNCDKFKLGMLVGRADEELTDSHTEFGFVERIDIAADPENGDMMTVSGRFLMAMLSRRVINNIFDTYGAGFFLEPEVSYPACKTIGNFVYLVIALNAVTPVSGTASGKDTQQTYYYYRDDNRTLSGLSIENPDNYDRGVWNMSLEDYNDSGVVQTSRRDLLAWVYKIAKRVRGSLHIGVNAVGQMGSDVFHLTFYAGTDRSETVVFSDTMHNLTTLSYADDMTSRVNYIYAFGSGEGTSRAMREVADGETPQYLARHESITETDTGDAAASSEETTEILTCAALESFSVGEVLSEASIVHADMQYKKDYFVGDTVTFLYTKLGLSIQNVRLVGMIESFSASGYELTPTFEFVEEEEEEE